MLYNKVINKLGIIILRGSTKEVRRRLPMPVVSHSEVENYKTFISDFDFLRLPKDKDVATVRFYVNSVEDLKHYIVHQVKTKNGKYRYVDCLRTYDQPIDECPFCLQAAQDKEFNIKKKMFLPVYVLDINGKEVNQTMVFERGYQFAEELEGNIRRYAPLVGTPCEIERQGEAKSMDTVYKVFPLAKNSDETTIEDLPEEPVIMGGYILELTFEQMETFLKTGELPKTEGAEAEDKAENLPRRTNRGGNTEPATEEDAVQQRRTARTKEV